ncbi:MAG: hypothetical protein ACSLFF_00145 [Solirubrobacterales bacterium]
MADADPHESEGDACRQEGAFVTPEKQHRDEGGEAEDVTRSSVKREPFGSTSVADCGATNRLAQQEAVTAGGSGAAPCDFAEDFHRRR